MLYNIDLAFLASHAKYPAAVNAAVIVEDDGRPRPF